MKKIFIVGIYPLEGSSSGEYCLDLAYWLHKLDYSVHLLTTSNNKVTLHNNIRQKEHQKDKYSPIKITDLMFPITGVPIKDFPAFVPHHMQGFKVLFRDMKSQDLKVYLDYLKEQIRMVLSSAVNCPDLIICNHITPLSGLIAELMTELKLKIPVIQIAHNVAVQAKDYESKGKVGRDAFADGETFDKLFVDLLEKGKKVCKNTIAVSEESFKGLRENGFAEKDITRRSKGFDPEIFHPNYEEINTFDMIKKTERGIFQDKNDHLLTACCAEYRKNFNHDYLGGLHGIFSKPYIFIFSGRMTIGKDGNDEKGTDLLLDAAIELKKKRDDFAIVVCGNGNNHHKMIVKAYESGLDNVFFVGDQDHFSVVPLWNAYAIAGVYPSRVEPLGIVAIECAACGTPAITTDVGGFKDFVAVSGGEVVVSSTPVKIAAAMNKSINENWKEKREPHFKKINKFSWAKLIKEIDQKIIAPYIK